MALKDGGIIVIDYGGQTAQLIARRVREAGVYAALLPYNTTLDAAREAVPDFRGLILSGGPLSIYAPDAPPMPDWALAASVPVLGICYGMQAMAHALGGAVTPGPTREFGPATLHTAQANPLLGNLPDQQRVWMSHNDHVETPPAGFESLASSAGAPFAAMGDTARQLYGVQFHPEVSHTEYGTQMLHHFVSDICNAAHHWTPINFIEASVEDLRARIGSSRVLLGLSGGVDSAVAAGLLARAIGDQLRPVFVNHGMLRQGEPNQVTHTFGSEMGLPLHAVDATETFLEALRGVIDPEEKRNIIGRLFVETFEAATVQVGAFDWLAQGTIYPDVIESAGTGRPGAKRIKSHHNVGGLPPHMHARVIEPLRDLFKDEVREVGAALGLPDDIVWRQPFPGPGLAIRCLGEVTWQRLEILRAADHIFTSELAAEGLLRHSTAQAFAVLLPVHSVGVMGDSRTYEQVIALRAVTTDDFMTADWARLSYDLLARVSHRIVNEVRGVNRVTYDITSKPPGTIEWE